MISWHSFFITWYSFFTAAAFGSIALAAVIALRSRTKFLEKYGVSSLLLLSGLVLVRMILPFEFYFSYIVQSWSILPAVRHFFRAFPWIWQLLIIVWGAGIVFVIIRDLYGILYAYRICRSYITVDDRRIQRLAKSLSVRCPVLVSPDVSTPFVSGLFLHKIYFPTLEMPDQKIKMLLQHEAQHVRSHDSQIKLLFGLLSAVLWWNPIIYKFRREIDVILEIRCDTKVTRHMDNADREAYKNLLVDMAKHLVNQQAAAAWSAAVGSTNTLKQRIEVLNAKPRPTHIAVKCCLAALFLASYLVIFHPAGNPPPVEGFVFDSVSPSGIQEEFLDKSGITCDNSFIFTFDEKYYLIVNGKVRKTLSLSKIDNPLYKDLEIVKGICKP